MGAWTSGWQLLPINAGENQVRGARGTGKEECWWKCLLYFGGDGEHGADPFPSPEGVML